MSFPASLQLSDLDGSNGFRIPGIDAGDILGFVGAAGDVNGDGIADLIVGATSADPGGRSSAGESYVVFGQTGSFASALQLSALDGSNGFRLDGIDAGDQSGWIAGAGDVNGDGVDDLLIGARQADPGGRYNAGETYVVYGQTGAFTSALDLSALDGTNGFRLDGIRSGDRAGALVRGVGDVNGDGLADVGIGASDADVGGLSSSGQGYVVFGRAGTVASALALSALDGTNGFRLDGPQAGAFSFLVAGAGDVNGDGIDDVMFNADRATADGRRGAGQNFVVFGQTGSFAPAIDLYALDGTNGFRLDGVSAGDNSGRRLAGAGDVNADGIADMIIGAFYADPGGRSEAGESYVVFGRAGSFAPVIQLSALDGSDGFRLDGINAGDWSGYNVAAAGDVNGDGIADLLIGATGADPNGRSNAGESYVVFGRTGGFGSAFSLSALDGTNGFRLEGIGAGDLSGFRQSSAGDVNGDGIDDVAIGAHFADPGGRTDAGEVYVIFGRRSVGDAITGTPGNDSLPGTADDDSIVGLAGNDTLTGLGGDDTLVGNAGADYLDGAGGDDVLLGGSGDDRLRGGGGNDSLNGNCGEDDLIGGKGDDTLNGGTSHDTITGGDGADRFYFAPDATLATTGDDADVITDFSVLEGDRINLVRFSLPDFAALQGLLAATGADTVITLSALPDGRDILVEGVTLAELDNAANFVL